MNEERKLPEPQDLNGAKAGEVVPPVGSEAEFGKSFWGASGIETPDAPKAVADLGEEAVTAAEALSSPVTPGLTEAKADTVAQQPPVVGPEDGPLPPAA